MTKSTVQKPTPYPEPTDQKKRHQRIYFTRLRHKYYTAGRVLFLHGCMDMGMLMLGYAIESHFKHALNELNFTDRKILLSHDLNILFKKCIELGVFVNVDVSNDFILFANDHFDQRYPSQQMAKSKEMLEGNRAPMLTPSILIAYDDLLIHLDDALWQLTGDHESSLGIIAAATATWHDSRIFFHCNAPALSMLEKYIPVVKAVYPTNLAQIAILEQGVNYLWRLDTIGVSFAPYEQLLKAKPAANFQYPGKIFRDEKGNISGMIVTSHFLKEPSDPEEN